MKFSSLFISFLVIFTVGCKKEDIGSGNGTVKIKELHYSVYNNFSSQFIYSQDGRISKKITKAWYNDPNDYYSSDTVEFVYNGIYVSSIRFSPTSFTNLVYDRNRNIIQSDFFHDGRLITSKKYFYNDRLLREIQSENGNSKILLAYDSKGNLSTKTYYFKGDISRIETFSEYDNKPNPFKGNQLVFDDNFDQEKFDYYSNNNPRKHEVEWITYYPGTYTFSYNYIYNNDGFWTEGHRPYRHPYSIRYY